MTMALSVAKMVALGKALTLETNNELKHGRAVEDTGAKRRDHALAIIEGSTTPAVAINDVIQPAIARSMATYCKTFGDGFKFGAKNDESLAARNKFAGTNSTLNRLLDSYGLRIACSWKDGEETIKVRKFTPAAEKTDDEKRDAKVKSLGVSAKDLKASAGNMARILDQLTAEKGPGFTFEHVRAWVKANKKANKKSKK